MTLVLGAPGSGKTTFLRALAGKLDSSLKLQGKFFYNDKTSPSTPHYLCSYVSQHDLHHPEMTVREIINFSSNLLGANNEFEMLGDAIKRNVDTNNEVHQELFTKATKLGEGSNLKTNYIIKILGLSDCADTVVGDALRRGISGGQKRRTTIGEMLVGRAQCFFMDNVSTGLDSSTTFDIMTFLRQMTHLMDLTMVISLLQPAPETFELFDDIIILCEGRIIYHGPRHNAVGFFNSIGFTCPSRKNVADFLQEVTSKMDQQQYWAGSEREYQYHSIESFEKYFRAYNLPRFLKDKQDNKHECNNTCFSFQIGLSDDLQPWLHWGYWASPFTYSLNAVALNEFFDKRWATVFYFENVNTTGEAVLKIRGLINEWHWNAMVGIPGVTGLSAEQRKRLTIAVELVANPSIIFMDEPTTGLDARAAAIVKRTVRKTVNTGRTVVCTIHQPSIEIFESFDEAIPGVPSLKEGQNPAAWALDISSHAMEYAIGVDYSEIYQNSSLHRENMALVAELSKPRAGKKYLHFPPRYWPNFKAQCITCLWKQHCSFWKKPQLNVTRFICLFGVSITFGMVFWQVGSTIKDEQDLLNILGTAYTSALFLGYMNCATLQPIITMERVVFYRERASGMYSSMAYVIAQIAVEIPYMFIQVFIFSAIVYPMVGFELTVTKFFWFVLYMMLSFIDFTLYGMMVVALTPNEEIAAILSFLIFMIWNIFAGYIIPRKMIPAWWRWMYWADPAAWTIYGLMLSQLGDRKELIIVPGESDQPVSEFLKEYLGLQDGYFALVTMLHIALSTLFGVVFCLGIKYLKFQRK
ncbi:unnamed protein product [Urochloa decumbens]|uniref:AAA+ ATPase domain-containing protein n=1 Tax=Urochloa decumbens TaxID=240449 RepID=A0ABC9EXW6_9POAL